MRDNAIYPDWKFKIGGELISSRKIHWEAESWALDLFTIRLAIAMCNVAQLFARFFSC